LTPINTLLFEVLGPDSLQVEKAFYFPFSLEEKCTSLEFACTIGATSTSTGVSSAITLAKERRKLAGSPENPHLGQQLGGGGGGGSG